MIKLCPHCKGPIEVLDPTNVFVKLIPDEKHSALLDAAWEYAESARNPGCDHRVKTEAVLTAAENAFPKEKPL